MICARPIADVRNSHHRSSARHKQSYVRSYRASYFCTADSFPSTSDPSLSGALFSGHHKCPVYMKLFLSSITSFVVLRTRDAGAIKNRVEENDCLSFWRKSLPASSGVRNYQKSSAFPIGALLSSYELASGDGIWRGKNSPYTHPGPWQWAFLGSRTNFPRSIIKNHRTCARAPPAVLCLNVKVELLASLTCREWGKKKPREKSIVQITYVASCLS